MAVRAGGRRPLRSIGPTLVGSPGPAVPTHTDGLRPSRLKRTSRVALLIGRDPAEAMEKFKERVASGHERLARRGQSLSYPVDSDWEERIHGLLAVPWPCPAAAEFAAVWSDIVETMSSRGLRVGRESYGGDDDADPGLSRALWCLARHLGPEHAIETGVAHGVSTRSLLEALERNGGGRLWSIDLPPVTIPERRREVAAAVPEYRRARWTYVEGSSRRRLPGLLRQLSEIQLFVHDSWHSTRNTLWELKRAWSALPPQGVLVADDIDHNWGFRLFVESVSDRDVIHCPADDGQRLFGIVRKRLPVEPLP
jgi:hypothetical protein